MLLKRLWTNRDGGVAPMLALAAIPIMGFVGAAIDFSRAASVRTAMQTALDATALMLSKEAQGMAPADLEQKASNCIVQVQNSSTRKIKRVEVTATAGIEPITQLIQDRR